MKKSVLFFLIAATLAVVCSIPVKYALADGGPIPTCGPIAGCPTCVPNPDKCHHPR